MTKRIILFLALAAIAIASTQQAGALTFENPLKVNTIGGLLDRVINFLIAISVPILTAVVLYAAFVLLTSEGKPEKFNQAMMIIVYAAIGFGIVLISKGIALVIAQIL